MRDEIKRISKLVAEGKLTPEDAADLISAFYESEEREAKPAEEAKTATAEADPASDSAKKPSENPLDSLIEAIERIGKEASESVDWKEIASTAKTSAKKGFELLKTGMEDFSKGKINLGWLMTQSTREIRLPLNVAEGKTIKIENACGAIRVHHDPHRNEVVANARFRAATIEESKVKADSYTLMVEDNQVISIKQSSMSGADIDLDIYISVPMMIEAKADTGEVIIRDSRGGARVTAKTGKIDVSGLNGPIDLNSETGEVVVQHCTTPGLVIENKAGSVTLNEVRGNINLRSASGQIDIRKSSGKTIAVEAVSGYVNLDLDEPVAGTVSVRTVNGNANVKIPDGSDCRVSLTTLRGVAVSHINLIDEVRNDQRVTGQLGEGAGSLDISAVTGNVSLSLRDSL